MRIVSLVPSITEALCRLGLQQELVGVTDYCLHPGDVVAAKTRIGGTKDPDLKKIRALAPDLVIANTDEQRVATLQELETGPWDLLVTATDSLDEVAETWSQIGRATDKEAAAEMERAALEDAKRHARDAARSRTPLAVIVPVWKHPWMAAGGGTYVGDLLAVCGFENLFAHVDEKWLLFHPTLDADEAEAQRPEKGPMKGRTVHAVPSRPDGVILPTEPYAFQPADRSDFAAIGVPAEDVRIVDGELLTWWLSRSVEALRVFTALHAGWKTPDQEKF